MPCAAKGLSKPSSRGPALSPAGRGISPTPQLAAADALTRPRSCFPNSFCHSELARNLLFMPCAAKSLSAVIPRSRAVTSGTRDLPNTATRGRRRPRPSPDHVSQTCFCHSSRSEESAVHALRSKESVSAVISRSRAVTSGTRDLPTTATRGRRRPRPSPSV